MSYCDHFSSVRPSVNIFKWLLLWSRWANFAQFSYGASLGWGNEKIAKMVAVRWPRWPPCPYMVKTFKNLLLQNWECLGAEPLQESSVKGGLPKFSKRIVVCWRLTFLRQGQVRFPMHLYGKKPLKIFFSKTEDALWLNLCIYHRKQEVYQTC